MLADSCEARSAFLQISVLLAPRLFHGGSVPARDRSRLKIGPTPEQTRAYRSQEDEHAVAVRSGLRPDQRAAQADSARSRTDVSRSLGGPQDLRRLDSRSLSKDFNNAGIGFVEGKASYFRPRPLTQIFQVTQNAVDGGDGCRCELLALEFDRNFASVRER